MVRLHTPIRRVPHHNPGSTQALRPRSRLNKNLVNSSTRNNSHVLALVSIRHEIGARRAQAVVDGSRRMSASVRRLAGREHVRD